MTSKNISRIVELKTMVKEQMSVEMMHAKEKLAWETAKLDGLKLELAGNMEAMDQMQSLEAVDTDKLELLGNYMIYLDKRMKEQEKKIAGIQKEVDAKQSELRNAYREERVFEILRSKMSMEEQRERQALEQKEMDFNTIKTRKTQGR